LAVEAGREPVKSARQEAKPSGRGKTIGAVRHAIELLRCVSEAESPLGVSEIARRIGVHKSTVSRLVATLEAEHLVARDQATERITLGLGLAALASPVLVGLGLKDVVRPYLRDLARLSGETASFSVWDGNQAVSLEQAQGGSAVRTFSAPGRRDFGHSSAAGKMLLAHAGEEVIEAYCAKPLTRFTERTIAEPPHLRAELEAARARGYAINTGETEIDVGAVSAAARDGNGKVVGTVTLTVPVYRFGTARRTELGEMVLAAATKLGRIL
jgi:DNA-binding IclR family transcriptional regulator